jgi:hypothetical protein
MVEVVLSNTQIMMAAQAGVLRHLQFLKRNARPMYGLDVNTDWKLQIEGALSEYALAKHLGVHWEGVGYPDADDVGKEDVRATEYDDGHLILHHRDKDNKNYWLLTGKNGHYKVRGFILGKNGKQQKYWQKREVKGRDRSAFFIPQSDLQMF